MLTALTTKTKNLAKLGYLLQFLGILFFITSVIGVLINHSRFAEVRGTEAESHFKWQIQTFWACIFAGLVAILLSSYSLGQYLMVTTALWYYYRVFKGFWALHKNKTAPKY